MLNTIKKKVKNSVYLGNSVVNCTECLHKYNNISAQREKT